MNEQDVTPIEEQPETQPDNLPDSSQEDFYLEAQIEEEFQPVARPDEEPEKPKHVYVDFEDMTLTEALGEFFHAPLHTIQLLISIATPRPRVVAPRRLPPPKVSVMQSRTIAPTVPSTTATTATVAEPYRPRERVIQPEQVMEPVRWRDFAIQAALYGAALAIGTAGSITLANSVTPVPGVFFLFVSFALAFFAQAHGTFAEPKENFVSRLPAITPDVPVQGIHPLLLITGLLLAFISYTANSDNHFSEVGFLAWLSSTAFVALSFYRPVRLTPEFDDPYNINNYIPRGQLETFVDLIQTVFNGIADGFRRVRYFIEDEPLVFAALLAMTLFGAFFRLQHLDMMLPEMTSDHVEKLLDAQRVYDGDYTIFFANNGGREPFQMYAMALISNIPGLGINFMTLKLLAAIEAIITLPVVFWLAREVVGERDRRFGTILGLSLVLLLSVSYWHVAVARVALRIILTPLVVSLFLIYLIRGIRHNSRADFIKVGLVLGFGLYTYQAIRMLPIVIITAAGLALFFHIRSRRAFFSYAINFTVAVIVAFVIFIPMFRYTVEHPEEFWRRTSGRLFGDAIVETTNEQGELVQRNATIQERVDAFAKNLPILSENMVGALLMFHYKGDVAWLHGYSNHETMDVLSATFLIVGLGAWLGWSLRRRDAVYWLIPLAALIMLLPSALSIAYPIENPSHTRTSGAMPEVYLIAGFGLALITSMTLRVLPRRIGLGFAIIAFTAMGITIYMSNYDIIYNPAASYRENYLKSALPHSEGGRILRDFGTSPNGNFGNAYIIASPYWWDHRAVAIEALLPPGTWQNTIPEEPGMAKFSNAARLLREAVTRNDRYTLDPNKDLLFFYNITDSPAAEVLRLWFPEGQATPIDSYMPGRDFVIYRVPALGLERLRQLLAEHGEEI